MLVSTLATSCTYRPFLVLDGRNLVFDLAVTLLVLNISSVPLFGAEFVERVSGVCDGATWGIFGASSTGGTAATFTFSVAVASKPLELM